MKSKTRDMGGPVGLAAAYELIKERVKVTILEQDEVYEG